MTLSEMSGEDLVHYLLKMVDSAEDAHPDAGLHTLRRLVEDYSHLLAGAHEVLSELGVADNGAASGGAS